MNLCKIRGRTVLSAPPPRNGLVPNSVLLQFLGEPLRHLQVFLHGRHGLVQQGAQLLVLGGFGVHLEVAQGHETVYEPDWAKPLALYLAQLLEDNATLKGFITC